MEEKSETLSCMNSTRELCKKLEELQNQAITTVTITKSKFDYSAFNSLSAGFSTLDSVYLHDNETENEVPQSISGQQHLRQLTITRNGIHSLEVASFPNLFQLEITGNKLEELRNGSFKNLTNLGHLVLKNNTIGSIGIEVFHGCKNLFYLDLSYNQLEVLDDGVFDELYYLGHLNLSHNKINQLGVGVFVKLSRLLHLNLSHNKLTNIQAGLFTNTATSGNGLDLSNNLIEGIQPGAFGHSSRISLDHNRLKVLKQATFTGLEAKYLDLSNNSISIIECGSFSECRLDSLSLEKNTLVGLNPEMFQGLTLCSELNLASNRIKSYSGAFQNFGQMKSKLNLSSNSLSELPCNGFVGLHNLHHLDLVGNKINKIDKEAFKGLDKLGGLWLAENHIRTLDADWFEPIKTVTCVRLDYNHINEIPQDLFKQLTRIASLSLNNNKLVQLPPGRIFTLVDKYGEVNLDNNKLIFIPPRAFCPDGQKTNFQHLSMQCNEISRIEPGAFEDVTVRNLLLGGNQIKEMEEGALRGLTIPSNLILDGNLIESVDILKRIPPCTAVRLADNKIDAQKVCLDGIDHIEVVSFEEHSYQKSNGKWELVDGIADGTFNPDSDSEE